MSDKDSGRRSRRNSGAITLRDVAKLAGVAPITASRALNTPDKVSPDVLKKVNDAVTRTGYVPNRVAGGLASARSRLIAAVVPSTVVSVFMETIETLNNCLFDQGYQLMLGQTSYSAEREEQLLEAIIGRRPDGIMLTGIMPPGKGRTRLLASGIPVVETWDLTPTPIDMVIGFSHTEIGRTVAHYLARKGHQHLALVRAGDARAERRAEAFKGAAARLGLPPVTELNVGAQRSLASGRQALAQLRVNAPQATAVFCSSDLLALGALTEARAQGLAVPSQMAVVGFGDVPFVSDMVPSLTTVRINGAEIGRRAAQALCARAQGQAIEQPVVDVGFAIVERESA